MQITKIRPTLLAFTAMSALHAAASAQAQTPPPGVTVSGRLILGPRHVSNSNPQGNGNTQLGGTQDGSSFVAVRGSEDIGGGLRANFALDSVLTANNGVAGNFTGFWNREATVGLSGAWGNVRAGRMVGLATTGGVLALADPLNGNATTLETTWIGQYTGLRFNNSIQYGGVFNNVFVGALYALGGQPTSSSHGRTMALAAGYQTGPMLLRASVQQSSDGSGDKGNLFAIGGFYTLMPELTLHGAYFNGKYDAGFAAAPNNAPNGPLFGTGLGLGLPLTADMKSDGVIAGVTWRASPAWTIKLATHAVKSKGNTFLGPLGPTDGKQVMVYAFGDYALSKRTSLQFGVDHNKWTGAWSRIWGSALEAGTGTALNGYATRTVISTGVKHVF